MSRTNRGDKIDPTEIQIIHAVSRTTRACWLFGDDPHSGKTFDLRKVWIEVLLKHFAAYFGIDLLCFTIPSNHRHEMLRSRPDIVKTWVDPDASGSTDDGLARTGREL